MKDLDFDELDRAVNSLLSGQKKPAPSVEPSVPVENVVTIDASPAPEPTTQPLAAKRSSGRFMDVVHPSSDMRTATTPSSPRPVSRVASTLSPLSTTQTPVNDVQPSESVATPPPTTPDWPDPLDFQSVTLPTDNAVTTPSVASDGFEQVEQSPLESPFLTDAKVEKRPLGAFNRDDALVESVPLAVDAQTTTANESPREEIETQIPASAEVLLPDELQSDLLSIESNESKPTEEPIAPIQPSTVEDEVAGPPLPIEAVSIPAQYTEQASTGDQPTGGIFDTEAYRKPLAHPKKKGTGWLVIIWILLLLIIGAGAGAAVYFYVLPQL